MSGQDLHPSDQPPRFIKLAVAASALLAAASAVLFYSVSQRTPPPQEQAAYQVTVDDKTCHPNELTVPAGKTVFEIHNVSRRTLEWEILDGVMVVEERENITPGLRSRLTARLKPGRYEITCGLLSNPRGTLTVLPGAGGADKDSKPPLKEFIGPLAEFRVYLVLQSNALKQSLDRLAASIRAGNLSEARQDYAAARLLYRRLDMITPRFADLKNVIDPQADYLAQREQDVGFTGFHRIGYGLFARDTTDGLADVADRLVADVGQLNTRLRALKLTPDIFGPGIERQARLLSEGPVLKGESPYARNDMAEFSASFASIETGLGLMLPMLDERAPDVAAKIRQELAGTKAIFDEAAHGGVFPGYDQIGMPMREKLSQHFATLADAVAQLNAALGLE